MSTAGAPSSKATLIWYFVKMRRTASTAILTVFMLSIFGCRTDRPTKQVETEDSSKPIPSAEAPSTAPLPRTAVVNDKRPLIVCFGDSLTAGYGAEVGKSYPDYLQEDLDAKGYHYRVVNQGIGGNTTKDGIDRIDSVLAMKPAVVVVEFGGNDGLRGLPIGESRSNLDKIINTLKASGIKVALAGITLPPDYGPDYIGQFNETYTLLAKKYNVPLLPFLLQGVFGVDGMMQADQTHATAEGNKIVANNVLPLILPLLKK
jgi:acyl-CoA thioesterase I